MTDATDDVDDVMTISILSVIAAEEDTLVEGSRFLLDLDVAIVGGAIAEADTSTYCPS